MEEFDDIEGLNYHYHGLDSPSTEESDYPKKFPYGPNPRSLLVTITLSSLQFLTFFTLAWFYLTSKRHYYFSTLMFSLKLFLIWRINKRDPGTVPTGLHLQEYMENAAPAKLTSVGGVDILEKWCNSCRLYQPPRAKHCYVCNRCIRRYDHHCPWVSNCIGYNNYKSFSALIMYEMIWQNYQIMVLTSIMKEVFEGEFSLFNWELYPFLFTNYLTLLLAFALTLATSLIFTVFNLFNKYLIATNQTMYQIHRIKREDNPYDEGFLNNFKAFARLPH